MSSVEPLIWGLAHDPCSRLTSPGHSGPLLTQLLLLLRLHKGTSGAPPCHMGTEIVVVLPGLLRSGYLQGLGQGGCKATSSQCPSHELKQRNEMPLPLAFLSTAPQTSPKMERWRAMWLTSCLTWLSPPPFIHSGKKGNLYFPFLNTWDLLANPRLKAET